MKDRHIKQSPMLTLPSLGGGSNSPLVRKPSGSGGDGWPFDLDKLTESKKNIVNKYLKNVDILFDLTNSINAQPIFINQPALRHENAETLFLLNYSLIAHCEKNKYKCIDLAKNFKALDNFWWDRIHTTPIGSQAIANHIFPKLLKFLK